MKNMISIYRNDLRIIRTNGMTALIIFAVVIIPLLFTSFNVLASWNPFGNTDKLQIAVASTDKGHKSDLTALDINLGDQVLSQLSRNEEIDWQITSEDKAIEGTKSGEYYAAIVLPPTFSEDLMTFYIEGKNPTKLALYTNQKKNALSTLITSRGAEGVIERIDESFAKVVTNVGLGVISSLNDYLNETDTQNSINRISQRLIDVSDRLDAGAATVRSLGSLVDSSLPLIQGADQIMQAAQNPNGDSAVQFDDTPIRNLRDTVNRSTDSLDAALSATGDSYRVVQERVQATADNAANVSGDTVGVYRSVGQQVKMQADGFRSIRQDLDNTVGAVLPPDARPAYDNALGGLDAVIARSDEMQQSLFQAADDIEQGTANAQQSRQQARDAVQNAVNAIAQARSAYSNDLRPQLDALGESVNTVVNDVESVKQSIGEVRAQLASEGSSTQAMMIQARDSANAMADRLNTQAQRMRDVEAAFQDAKNSGDFSKLSGVINNDPELLATRIATPVTVNRNAIFPVRSFGVGMSPFYMTLALWVGSLLASVLVKVNAEPEYLRRRPKAMVQKPNDADGADSVDGAVSADSAAETGTVTPSAALAVASKAASGETDDEAMEKKEAEQDAENSYSRNQVFLGRLITLLTIAAAQATLLALGLIVFIEIQPQHPFLLILAAIVVASVFMIIIYSLVMAFDNAGKALAVVLLIVQVSGASGAYPLPLLPQWFQNISPWLPATYAVEAFRSAIAGIYHGDLWRYLGILLLFTIPSFILGLWLRRLMDGYLGKMKKAIADTKVMAT